MYVFEYIHVGLAGGGSPIHPRFIRGWPRSSHHLDQPNGRVGTPPNGPVGGSLKCGEAA